MENGVVIRNNLSVDWVHQQFETPRKFFQTKQTYSWIEERLAHHRMPQATPIIPHEV